MTKLILASASPRRRFLLKEVGVKFKVRCPEVNEDVKRGESSAKYVQRLSYEKARMISNSVMPKSIVLAADTTVVLNGSVILHKPRTVREAFRMISRLQGRSHDVLTGVTLLLVEKTRVFKCKTFMRRTRVTFRKLSPKKCMQYAKSREGMDKAGAYAAQGRGMGIVSKINGSYTNVVGLPISDVLEVLEKEFGYGN